MKTRTFIILCLILLSCSFVLRAKISGYDGYNGVWYSPIEYPGLTNCVYAVGPTTETGFNTPSHIEIASDAIIDHRSKTVLGIGKNAFEDLGMDSVSLPGNLIYMGENAFSNCTRLKKVKFRGCSYRNWILDKIPAGAFSGCWNLHDINLPSTVQSIGDQAFFKCKHFYSFTLSDNINYIGEKAFAECVYLWTVISLNLNPPVLKSYRTEKFPDGEKQLYDNFDFNRGIKLYVPENAVESYKNAPGWNQFASILPLSELPVERIELSDRKQSIRLNQKGALIRAEVYPSVISNRQVEWSSSNEEVVTVEPKSYNYNCGELFPHKPGKAQIVASIGEVKAVCEVEVTFIPANSISIEPAEVEVMVDSWDEKITIKAMPKESLPYLNIWCDNPDIAELQRANTDSTYYISAKKAGECKIWVEGGDLSATCLVKVPPRLPDYVTLDADNVTIKPGSNFVLKATVKPESTTDKTIIWKSYNPYVASVDENGKVTGNHVGICNIVAQCGGLMSKNCVVSVKPDSLEFEKSKIILSVGESYEIKLKPYSEAVWNAIDIIIKGNRNSVWIDRQGKKITALEPTETEYPFYKYSPSYLDIYWKTDTDQRNRLARLEVNVPPIYVDSLSLVPKEWNAIIGETIKLNPTIFPENSSRRYVELKSSNPAVVKVDWTTWRPIEAVGVGEAIIYAKVAYNDHDVTAECHVTVRAPEILVSSISLSPSSVEDKEGEQIQITATILPEDATNKAIRWSSSDESIAIVDDNGLISLVKKGTAVITASATDDSGVSAECAVVVSGLGGIEDVIADKSVYAKIFNLKGVLVYEGIYSDAKLLPDYYVIVCDGKNIKVKVE